jgi:hypothetical protein
LCLFFAISCYVGGELKEMLFELVGVVCKEDPVSAACFGFEM